LRPEIRCCGSPPSQRSRRSDRDLPRWPSAFAAAADRLRVPRRRRQRTAALDHSSPPSPRSRRRRPRTAVAARLPRRRRTAAAARLPHSCLAAGPPPSLRSQTNASLAAVATPATENHRGGSPLSPRSRCQQPFCWQIEMNNCRSFSTNALGRWRPAYLKSGTGVRAGSGGLLQLKDALPAHAVTASECVRLGSLWRQAEQSYE